MDNINLKGTNLSVSRLCFGTMTFGGQVDEPGAQAMVDHCLEAGVNFFDTANVYTQGASETLLGQALKGRRSKVILASKVGMTGLEVPAERRLSKEAIQEGVEGSLRRLQTDYLDLYYLHRPDYSVPLEETLETMDQLVKQGKVRYPACSNYASWQIARMGWLADKAGYRPVRIAQQMHNLLARGIEQEYLPMAQELGVSTVVYNPLAGGLLTGKHQRERPIEGTRFDGNAMYRDRYWHPAYFDAVEELQAVARNSGRSLVSLSLNWLLTQKTVDGVILGASSLPQLEENLKAAEEGSLSSDTMAACNAVWDKLRGVTPKYNR
ncbi:MAG: aldo/keto reductase [Acidobacteria bacterium]|nr:aldo/keto reductase [Acidobacteriota bacterium]MCI0717847.1 aldo/keto reductase [Acidobacteriota bacterium]